MQKVSPTRINLLSLKKELKTAEKGYKLLKDKRDGLIKKFMEIIKETRDLRSEVEEEIPRTLVSYIRASASIAEKINEAAFLVPNAELEIDVKTRYIMSVPIPHFDIKTKGRAFSYGFLETSGELDNSVQRIEKILPKLLHLSELEKTVENLAEEIERTRRRTSALENVRIPQLNVSIRYIREHLDEQARDAIVSTMRIKAMIMAKE